MIPHPQRVRFRYATPLESIVACSNRWESLWSTAVGHGRWPWLERLFQLAAHRVSASTCRLEITHGFNRSVLLTSHPAVSAFFDGHAPRIAGIPILINVPLLSLSSCLSPCSSCAVCRECAGEHIMVVVKLLVLGLFVVVGGMNIDTDNYVPFAPNGWRGIHQGAAIIFFAYIGFDAISTAAEETRNPQRNMPIGILGGLAICTVIYVIVGAVATGLVPYQELKAADPCTGTSGCGSGDRELDSVRLEPSYRSPLSCSYFSTASHAFFFAMARDGLLPPWAAKVHGKYRTPYIHYPVDGNRRCCGSALRRLSNEIYDLTNIGTLSAFRNRVQSAFCGAQVQGTGSPRLSECHSSGQSV